MKTCFMITQEKNKSKLIPKKTNALTEEDKIKTQDNSKNNIKLNSPPPEILLNKKRKPEESPPKKKNNSQFQKKNDFLNIEKIEDCFSFAKNSEKKNFENLIREKHDLDLKSYIHLDKNFYTQLIKEEENYMEDTISRISDFSKQKNFPEFFSEKNSNLNKKSTSFFFVVNKNENDDGVCNYLENVPYLCQFPSCKRKFFTLKNLEKHTH